MRKIIITLTILFFLCPLLHAQLESRQEEALYVAKKAYDDGFYDVALNLFKRFLRNYPENQKVPEANLYIAQCYFQQKKFIPALTLLEKLSSDPAAKNLKDTVLYWIGEVHFNGKDYRRAISFYQRVIEEFPNSEFLVHALYSKGWCLFELGEFDRAAEFFGKVIDSFPGNPIIQDANFKILECLYNLKDYEKLRKEIRAYKMRYPEDTTYLSHIHFLLAESSYYLDDYNEAIKQYQTAINKSSDGKITALSQLGLAWCRLRMKNYEEAQKLLDSVNRHDLTEDGLEGLLLAKANLFSEIQNFQSALEAWTELQEISTEPKTKAQAYLGKADALYNLGQYPEAIAVYQEAQNISSNLPAQLLDKLHYGLAWAYLKDGEFRQAIDEFQRTASFASDEIIKVAALCQVGDTYQDAEEYQKAIDIYDQVLKDHSDSFYADYAQYQLGLACLRLSRYDEAALAFKTLLLNFPKSKLRPETIYSLALTFFQKQEYQRSQETLRKYMPDLKDTELEAEALYLLATSLYNLGEFSEALDYFRQVIRKASDTKIIQKAEYEIADCFYQIGNEREATKRFKQLRAKYPDSALSPEVTWWLGGYYFRKGNLIFSRRYFSSLVRDFPESGLLADGYYALGLLDQEEGRLDSAIENFKTAIQLGSKNIRSQANIAIADILVEQAKLDEAEAAYRQAMDNSPELAGLIYPKISRIYEKRGEFDEVIRLYRQALSLASMKEAPKLQFKIARVYEKKGDYGQAVEEYLKIPYLYPADSQLVIKAYLSSAQIYENQGNWPGAMDIYSKVASMDVEEAKFAQERVEWIEVKVKGER